MIPRLYDADRRRTSVVDRGLDVRDYRVEISLRDEDRDSAAGSGLFPARCATTCATASRSIARPDRGAAAKAAPRARCHHRCRRARQGKSRGRGQPEAASASGLASLRAILKNAPISSLRREPTVHAPTPSPIHRFAAGSGRLRAGRTTIVTRAQAVTGTRCGPDSRTRRGEDWPRPARGVLTTAPASKGHCAPLSSRQNGSDETRELSTSDSGAMS